MFCKLKILCFSILLYFFHNCINIFDFKVKTAANWKTVPPRFRCLAGMIDESKSFSSGNSIQLKINTEACRGKSNNIQYLEHVQVSDFLVVISLLNLFLNLYICYCD